MEFWVSLPTQSTKLSKKNNAGKASSCSNQIFDVIIV